MASSSTPSPLAVAPDRDKDASQQEQLQQLLPHMIETLIRNKVLYPYRLLDRYYPIAMDGTGMLTFPQRHCPHCLTRTLRGMARRSTIIRCWKRSW